MYLYFKISIINGNDIGCEINFGYTVKHKLRLIKTDYYVNWNNNTNDISSVNSNTC